MSLQMDSEIAALETRAEELRARFFAPVDALDRRQNPRPRATTRGRRAPRARVGLEVAVGLALVAGALWVALEVAAARRRRAGWGRAAARLVRA